MAGCGGGFSSIVVADGVIYGTGSARGKNVAWARNESDGKPIWSQPYADGGSEPNSTPIVSGWESLRPHPRRRTRLSRRQVRQTGLEEELLQRFRRAA